MDLSIVIPVFNEEDNVKSLIEELDLILKKLGLESEVLLIDDGSGDKSSQIIKEEIKNLGQSLKGQSPFFRLICLNRNFGQTAAIACGFNEAKGSVVITMDGDRQNDPHNISALLKKIKEGADVVSGWRKNRKAPYLLRRLPSCLANLLISKMTGVKLHDYGCTLKAYRQEVVKRLSLYGEMHRFIPALASWGGAKVSEIVVNDRVRTGGKSKYGISRTLRVLLDLLTVKFLLSYSTRPIQIFGAWGLIFSLWGIASLAGLISMKIFMGVDMTGNPLLILSIFLWIIGVQFIALGLLAEIIARTYHESQKKSIYIIKDKYP